MNYCGAAEFGTRSKWKRGTGGGLDRRSEYRRTTPMVSVRRKIGSREIAYRAKEVKGKVSDSILSQTICLTAEPQQVVNGERAAYFYTQSAKLALLPYPFEARKSSSNASASSHAIAVHPKLAPNLVSTLCITGALDIFCTTVGRDEAGDVQAILRTRWTTATNGSRWDT